MKKTTFWPRLLLVTTLVSATSLVACSLILDKEKDQCASNGDCAKFGSGYTCNAGVCQKPTASTDGAVDPDGAVNPDGGDAGCTPKVPKVSREEFLNETCTDSKCIPFDNCARLGVCEGDAALPALVDPPDGGV
jgi:hypothetical protein